MIPVAAGKNASTKNASSSPLLMAATPLIKLSALAKKRKKLPKKQKKPMLKLLHVNAKIAKKIAKRELVRQKNAAKFEALYIMRAEKAKNAQKK